MSNPVTKSIIVGGLSDIYAVWSTLRCFRSL